MRASRSPHVTRRYHETGSRPATALNCTEVHAYHANCGGAPVLTLTRWYHGTYRAQVQVSQAYHNHAACDDSPRKPHHVSIVHTVDYADARGRGRRSVSDAPPPLFGVPGRRHFGERG